MRSFASEVIEAAGGGDLLPRLKELHPRRSGNNPAHFAELKPMLVVKRADVDVFAGHGKLVLLTRDHGFARGYFRDTRNALEVDLDRYFARGRNVGQIAHQPIGDVDRGCHAARGQCNGRFNPRYRMRETRPILLAWLPAFPPRANSRSRSPKRSGYIDPVAGSRTRPPQRRSSAAQRRDSERER